MKIVELLMRNTVPHKKFFNSNEIVSLLNIQPQEIRSWETEFPQIRSHKTAKGQKIFRREDVILFASIKHLLKEKKLTTAGAQRVLSEADVNYLLDEEPTIPSTSVKNEPLVDAHLTLEEAARILPIDDDEFDDRSQKLYQQCTHISAEIAPIDTVIDNDQKASQSLENSLLILEKNRLLRLEYDRIRARLLASRDILRQVLLALDRYNPVSFVKDDQTA